MVGVALDSGLRRSDERMGMITGSAWNETPHWMRQKGALQPRKRAASMRLVASSVILSIAMTCACRF